MKLPPVPFEGISFKHREKASEKGGDGGRLNRKERKEHKERATSPGQTD
jgi:hypothetical protein